MVLLHAVDGVSLLEIMAQSKGFFDDIRKKLNVRCARNNSVKSRSLKSSTVFIHFANPA